MADSDKLIGIFPETGQSGLLPRIEFTGKDNKRLVCKQKITTICILLMLVAILY